MNLVLCVAPCLADDAPAKGWTAPFGGQFNAAFTVASEYATSGISLSQRQPVFQAGLDYRTPDLTSALPVWLYGSIWGTTADIYGVGPGVELDFTGGGKVFLFDKRLKFDLSYIRYTYPGMPGQLDLNYSELGLDVDYNFGWMLLNGRLRYSPNNTGDSGTTWNKRVRVSVPLDFLKKLNDDVSFTAIGALGNYWLENAPRFGVDRNEYWYWQIGVVVSVWGLDVNLAYTATDIPASGCLGTANCAGRFLAGVTKAF